MTTDQGTVRQQMDSGIESLVLRYETIRQFSTPQKILRSTMDIRSLDLGVITLEQYRYVARRTSQGDQLFRRHLHKLLRDLPEMLEKNRSIRCVSVPAYGRLLRNGTLSKILFEELSATPSVSASNICVELSTDFLFEEDMKELAKELFRVRSLGVPVALMELGDPFCPLLRLFDVPFDYAILDSYAVSAGNERQDELLMGLCNLLHTGKTLVFAPRLKEEGQISRVQRLGCDGYSLAEEKNTTEDEE